MSSRSEAMLDCLRAYAAAAERHQALTWLCRVASASNPADEPSRGCSDSLSESGVREVRAVFPDASFFGAA
eukprot:4532923-Amphidinium_carterae.1